MICNVNKSNRALLMKYAQLTDIVRICTWDAPDQHVWYCEPLPSPRLQVMASRVRDFDKTIKQGIVWAITFDGMLELRNDD